jgi:hypothetical protein
MWRKNSDGSWEFLVGGAMWGRIVFLPSSPHYPQDKFAALFTAGAYLIGHYFPDLKDAKRWIANMYIHRNDEDFCRAEQERWQEENPDFDITETRDAMRILGLRRGFTKLDVKRAFRQLIKKYHPDISESGDHERAKKIIEAYEALMRSFGEDEEMEMERVDIG